MISMLKLSIIVSLLSLFYKGNSSIGKTHIQDHPLKVYLKQSGSNNLIINSLHKMIYCTDNILLGLIVHSMPNMVGRFSKHNLHKVQFKGHRPKIKHFPCSNNNNNNNTFLSRDNKI
jgi:hypothetical protein